MIDYKEVSKAKLPRMGDEFLYAVREFIKEQIFTFGLTLMSAPIPPVFQRVSLCICAMVLSKVNSIPTIPAGQNRYNSEQGVCSC